MPAPAVIPALAVYINTVVVKTLVVDLRIMSLDSASICSYVALCYNWVVGSMVGSLGV